MNNSVLENDPNQDTRKTSSIIQRKGGLAGLKSLFAQAARKLDSWRVLVCQLLHQQNGAKASAAESISEEDKVAILKTQCDYVRSCYRIKILERQQAQENVPQNLEAEIDELLDSYQRLKRAYEQLEGHDP